MGNGARPQNQKVLVRASEEMAGLRQLQTELNHYLWATEISLAYYADTVGNSDVDKDTPVIEFLNHLSVDAFVKNNQGVPKYNLSVGHSIEQAKLSMPYLYRTVITYFSTALEQYLEKRVRPLRSGKNRVNGGLI